MKRLDEIEARTTAATEGPWTWATHSTADGDEWAVFSPADWALAANRDGWGYDAEFIAHARQDVPALVAALRAVLALHRIIRVSGAGGHIYEVCQTCNQPAPCAYIQTIHQHLGENT